MRLWLGKHFQTHPLLAPVILLGTIITVYYPAVQSGIHPVDDPGIIAHYTKLLTLSQVLLPTNSYYYRPLVEFSFWLDNLLWGMEPSVMHLENILLHYANSLLVFVLACKVTRQESESVPLIPLVAALWFALFPTNVEAVTWIAGRTDPLLALFALSAVFFWLRWLETPRWQDMAATFTLFGAALLSKETALVLSVVLALLAIASPGSATIRQRSVAIGILAGPVLLLVLYALFFHNGSSGLSRFLSSTNLHPGQALWDALIALGFYAKKLFVPFPLNYAIYEVHPLYGLAGVILLPLAWWEVCRHRLAGLFFVSAALVILPAVLVAVKQVAWTLFAERYLYLPTAFFVLGVSVAIRGYCDKHRNILLPVALCLLVFFAGTSYQRAKLWSDKLAFFQDAVAKSPGFGSVHYSLGGLLFQNGKIQQAADAFATADHLNKRDSMRYPIKAAIMRTKLAQGDFNGARSYFFCLFGKKEDAPDFFLELLHKTDARRIGQMAGREKALLANDLLGTLQLLNQKKPDPFWLYRSGQISLMAGDKLKAAHFFRRAYATAPADAHYRDAAKTSLTRLEQAQ